MRAVTIPLGRGLLAVGIVALAACGDTPSSTGDDDDDSAAIDAGTPDATPVPDAKPNPLGAWCTVDGADFSFFVTSMDALWKLSGSAPLDLAGGFGGDFGGLEGADEICQIIGDATGHGDKTWRAFLSATDDGGGNPVHAIERIGDGPWYDANGRQIASGISGLLGDRPDGDAQATSDLPDECGQPLSLIGDSHDIVTGSNQQGRLSSSDPDDTCNDWTSSSGSVGSGFGSALMCGHSFPRMGGFGGRHWLSDHPLRGCGKGANLEQNGPGEGTCIGCSGGYGALYCFAL